MSAVGSTTTGGLPAPAPIAFLPLDSTALTMPGHRWPPAAAPACAPSSRWCSRSRVPPRSRPGSAGAPATASAALILRISQWVIFVARGCGLNTTALPAASMPMPLLIIVSVGLVVGVIAPITPKGDISKVVRPSSPDQASVVRSSSAGSLQRGSRFLTILSSTRCPCRSPRPWPGHELEVLVQ